jgi:hypothetical protein
MLVKEKSASLQKNFDMRKKSEDNEGMSGSEET